MMKRLKKIRTGIFSRHYTMGKMISGMAKDIYFSKRELMVDKLNEALSSKVEGLTDELGQLKGSFLKAGQLLSLYAEDLLPPEMDNLFKKLQSETSYLHWDQISKQLDEKTLRELKIEEIPFAAASIGQVHRATDGQNDLVLKIQYQKIEKVIDMDLRMLKLICRGMKFIPKSLDLDELFSEIKLMLLQEMDYKKEVSFMQRFYKLAKFDYKVPIVYPEYSTDKAICSEYVEAQTVESAVNFLNQEQRNQLGKDFFNLFFKELVDWKLIQSDAHLGNYMVKDNKWVLLDFGATKEISNEVSSAYHELIVAISQRNKIKIREIIDRDNLVDWDKTDQDLLWKYFELISRPFVTKNFDWGESSISKDAINMGRQMLSHVKFNFVPHKTFFIDRKVSGLYYMLKILGAQGDIIPREYLR